ncbi:galactokinase [Echinicola vietnamensis]|uniref:Galactokinase n=1 Tax=Echinicola vietnamensis (strain DSM 17526 / LMG 23754 / KMM 6221) TaxID=926556 RepID=L0FVC2_ECHVK|nr:galactokinase [Echinicola vietnamensis]AGA76973.1 galactokinase [Echinicola vietnamensis DSM 17526]
MNPGIIRSAFEELFDKKPIVVKSPGRINLIGEHTDYNEGFVLPAAINKEIVIAVQKNDSDECRLFSQDFQESLTFDLHDFERMEGGWGNYVMGVVAQLQQAGYPIEGFDLVFGGDVPVGAGLSSSAAVENGVCLALSELFGLGLERLDMLKFAQKAEHEFAGVQCGIMDQFASMMGKDNHAIRLDCRSLEYSYFPIDLGDYQIILCDTQVKHSLADSAYNDRRRECQAGVAAVQQTNQTVKSLRDVTLELLEETKSKISEVVFRRCKFVIEENARLLKGCELLEKGDIKGFGQQMYGSHDGLSGLYEVSCKELDFLADFAKSRETVAGARMMGGGFGGCTINLVEKGAKETFEKEVAAAYEKAFGKSLQIYEVEVTDGTRVVG